MRAREGGAKEASESMHKEVAEGEGRNQGSEQKKKKEEGGVELAPVNDGGEPSQAAKEVLHLGRACEGHNILRKQ